MSSFDSEHSTEYENDLVLDGEVNPIITQSISQILIDVIKNNPSRFFSVYFKAYVYIHE